MAITAPIASRSTIDVIASNADQKSIRIFKQMPSTRHIVKVLLNRPMRPAKNVIAIGQGLTTAT
jgi:hypothetical protein